MLHWIRRVLNAARWARFVQGVRRALGLPWGKSAHPPPPTGQSDTPQPPLRDIGEATLRKRAAPPSAPAPAPAPQAQAATPAIFNAHDFEFAHRSYPYRLYVPAGAGAGDALPLVVLLHGCKQNAADFALGTAMNAQAQARQCLVLYPEQLTRANMLRCWNWFDTAHQARDQGEPALIAALTRHVLKLHNADPARVYIAGLSAGGAMAAVVAGLYPDLFAAVGVHSGLPPGAATDVMSAFSAMRRGSSGAVNNSVDGAVMPTIVFHGSADQTVHPVNGGQVTDAALAALNSAGMQLEKTQHNDEVDETEEGRSTLRTIYRSADGRPYVEYWEVERGPHAWSGGHAEGSFTDPQGPNASQAMLEFFLQHRK